MPSTTETIEFVTVTPEYWKPAASSNLPLLLIPTAKTSRSPLFLKANDSGGDYCNRD
jgi:hypothetical protein